MIDFVRMNYTDKSSVEPFICNQENFPELRSVLEVHSGEIEYPYKVKLKNMDITVTEKRVCVKNSLHKLNNFRNQKGDRNHNDFTYSELVENITFIENSLIDLDKSNLSKLEFGLNIELDVPAEQIIRNNIIMHNFKVASHNNKYDGRGVYKQFDHSNYFIKIYDKSKQYSLSNNVLRFEIKYRRNKGFNPFGVYNISDLKQKKSLEKMFMDLMKRFEEMTIIDDYKNNPNISEQVKNQIEKYTSFNYWENLSDRKDRNKKARETKRFKTLLEENNLLTIKAELRDKLKTKFDYLINH